MSLLRSGFCVLAGTLALSQVVSRPPDIAFEKHTLDLGANESCAIGDFNKDGRLDIVSGENWFEAPKWTRHKFRSLPFNNNYIDNFSDLVVDVNGDGYADIVSGGWFSRQVSWWENPGKSKAEWKAHVIDQGMNMEFAFLVDLNNDGKALEVLPQYGGPNAITAWYELQGGKWVKRLVSPKGHGHGIGAGDVNGDGKADVLTPQGWFEAPDWKFHPDWEFKKALSFMHVNDVNGDGRPDIVSSYAHDYGVFWLERGAGAAEWTERKIDDTWSQAHAIAMTDLNGDGKRDFISGKRYLAHEHEPGAFEAPGIYWYEPLVVPKPIGNGALQWVRHVIDYGTRTGAGMQIPVVDLDGDGDLDFAVGGKTGVFVFENKTK